jgi:hypothetical protein
MREEYGKLNRVEMSIWECCELLNEVVDESDPDLDEPQIMHLLQSAEAIRKDYPDEDWLHLTALIHGIYMRFLFMKYASDNSNFKHSKMKLKIDDIYFLHAWFQILERFSFFLALEGFLNGQLLVSGLSTSPFFCFQFSGTIELSN